MALNITNPFSGLGSSLLEGLVPRLAQRRDEQRMIESMNPVRELILNQFTGQQPFAGGPASEFSGQASPFADLLGGQRGQMVPQAPGVTVTPANVQPEVQDDRAKLPPDLKPPPGIDAALKRAADRHGVPVNALRAMAAQESNFRASVIGQTPIDLPGQEGDLARGLFQFTPQEIRKMPGFDPNDPEQAADETARRLRARLEEGKPIDIAMMEHFGGPDPSIHGPRTRKYLADVREKFQRLEQSTAEEQPMAQVGQGEQVGPFGTIMQEGAPEVSPAAQLLAAVAQDPRAFAQQFAGEGGMERIMEMLQGGTGGAATQTRVISGDTPEGQAMGIKPGERARVEGTVLPSGQFFPQNVKAAPFGEDDTGGGPLVTLMNMETGKAESRRRDDPEVDQLIRSGKYVVASDGRAMESLEQMSQGELRQMRDSQVGVRTYVATVGDALQMLNENPDINTFVARGASLINDMRQEARALAGAMGTEFDDDIFSVGQYQDTFRELGVERERMQSMITSLAFQRAVAEKGGAGRITNRDIERFIAEIGGRSSDPVALAQVLQDTAHRAARGFRINFETRTGAPFEGDLGLDRLPRFSPRTQFDPTREERVGQTDNAAAGVPSEMLQAVPSGFQPGNMTPDGRLEVIDQDGNIVGHIEP